MLIRPLRLHRLLAQTRSVAALEFAIAAPVMFILVLATIDGARALLIWEQMHNAANAIAQAAEKLSVTTNSSGAAVSELTADQMQQAMSVIYAEIPGLNLGNGGGLFPGNYGVALSSVTYTPLCTAASGCAAQVASLVWTSSLSVGGAKLQRTWTRSCLIPPIQVAHMPDSALDLLDIPSPVLAGGTSMTLAPQVVADVIYKFTPWFPFFPVSGYFYATATYPAPVGGLDMVVTFNTSGGTTNVTSC
jgi:Flp pilus assembly protein TadG